MISSSDAFILEREKVSAASALYRLETITTRGLLYDRAYAMLDSFFGPKGELESKDDLGAMIEQRDIWFAESMLFARYHLVVAWHGDELVGVRDCYTEIDPARRLCLIALSHSLIVPAHRRTGLASLFRTFPIGLARELIKEFFGEANDIPILVTAEMEPVEPLVPETMIRYLAYGRSGFSALDPCYLPYSQPDFRDLEALGFTHIAMPLIAIVRWVGNEDASSLPQDLASAFPRHYNGFHYHYIKKEHVDAMLQNALSTLASKATARVPLLPLPKVQREISLLRPLLKSQVLPLYPPKLRGEHSHLGDPEAEFAILRQS
jgi:hypothetical protein